MNNRMCLISTMNLPHSNLNSMNSLKSPIITHSYQRMKSVTVNWVCACLPLPPDYMASLQPKEKPAEH